MRPVSEALEKLNLTNLRGGKSLQGNMSKNDRFKNMFPLNPNNVRLIHGEKYVGNFASTGRLQKSYIPAMQKTFEHKFLRLLRRKLVVKIGHHAQIQFS